MDRIPVKPYEKSNEEARRKAARWREEWLSGIKLGESYDVEAREKAATWAIEWGRQSYKYYLNDYRVAPFCTEIVLEALQLHGGRSILPIRIDRLEDITIGIGSGYSMMGEICGALSAHVIAIGIDVAYRTRETALLRKKVGIATRKFCRLFKEKFGHLRCEDLTNVRFIKDDDSFDLEAAKKFRTGSPPKALQCENIIRFSIYAPLPSEEE